MRPARFIAAAGMLAVLTSACGSQASAITVVARVADKTAAADTARVSERIHITPSSTSSTAVQDITADGTADFLLQQVDLTTTAAGQQIEVVIDNGTIYEKFAAASAATGKPWLKTDFNALGKLIGVKGLGDLMQSQSNDPTQGLQFLRGVSGPIKTVGHDTVRGTHTTHYQVTTDLALAAQKLPAAEQATTKQIIDLFGIHTAMVDVWIDAQNRARRFHYSLDYGAAKLPAGIPATSLPKSIDFTVEFYDFGTTASIAVPTSDQVADFAQLLNPAPKPAAAGSPAATALERLLISSPPAGFQQAADSVGDTGASDLAKPAKDDGQPGASQALTAAGFVAGYQRMWTLGQDRQIIEFLYQFGTVAGAQSYEARTLVQGVAPHSGDTIAAFAVPGIPGAHGLTVTGKDGPVAMVEFGKGGYLTQFVVNGPGATPQLAIALAAQQFGRL